MEQHESLQALLTGGLATFLVGLWAAFKKKKDEEPKGEATVVRAAFMPQTALDQLTIDMGVLTHGLSELNESLQDATKILGRIDERMHDRELAERAAVAALLSKEPR